MLVILLFSIILIENVCANCDEMGGSAKCESVFSADDIDFKYVSKLEIDNHFIPLNLRPGFINEFTRLRHLTVRRTRFRILYADSFSSSSITDLLINQAGLREIEPGAFRNMSNIDFIDLSDNEIQIIREGTFVNIPLRILRIFRNNLKVFQPGAIENLPKFQRLKLDYNKIEEINCHEIMDHPETLENIWIRANRFKKSFQVYVTKIIQCGIFVLGGQ